MSSIKLDIGAGLCPRGEDYICVDRYNVGTRAYIENNEVKHIPAEGFKFVKADMMSLPFSNDSVDQIWSAHVLEHLAPKDISIALKEWLRVLKVGKRAIIQVPSFDYVARYWLTGPDRQWAEAMVFGDSNNDGGGHKTAFTTSSIRGDLEGAGFEVLRVEMRWNHNQETLQAIARKKAA